jgi:hypothetical protein
MEVALGTGWDEGTPFSEIKRLRAELAATLKEVSDIMPGAGSYFNEVRIHSNSQLKRMS